MARAAPRVTLGNVADFRYCRLAIPGAVADDPRDLDSPVRMPAAYALRLLLVAFEKRWKLKSKDQAALLKVSPATLERYRTGQSVPRRREQLERIADLLRCRIALRLCFPYNPNIVDAWLTLPNKRFRPNAVAYMRRHGVKPVERYLWGQLVN